MQRVGTFLFPVMILLSACETQEQQVRQTLAQDGVSFHGPSVVYRHSEIALDARTQGRFERFSKEAQSFAAMYVAPNGRGWGVHSKNFTLDDVKQVARITCESSGNRNCVLYATSEPVGPVQNSALPNAFQRTVFDGIAQTSSGNVFALAATLTGRSGTAVDQASEAEARSAALDNCKKSVRVQSSEMSNAAFTALQRAGKTRCNVVAVVRKD